MEESAKVSTTLGKCICHKEGVTGKLSLLTAVSLAKVKEASQIRQDNIISELVETHSAYHRECYQSYTNKDHLQRITRKRQGEISQEITFAPKQRRTIPTFNQPICIICQKQKYGRNKKNLEILVQCQTFEAGKSITSAAEIRKDEKVLLQIRGIDLIAEGIKYHRSCFQQYTNKKSLNLIINKPALPTVSKDEAYNKAFLELSCEVQDRVIDGYEIMTMTMLLERYIMLLNNLGIEAKSNRSYKLKQKLQKRFINQFNFGIRNTEVNLKSFFLILYQRVNL